MIWNEFIGSPYEATDIMTPWDRENKQRYIYAPKDKSIRRQAFFDLMSKMENPLCINNMFRKIIRHKKQNEWKLKEINLAEPIIKYFTSLGYKCAQEWFGVDLLFFRGDHIIAVELKKSLSRKVICQARNDYYYAHLAYSVVGTTPKAASLKKAKELGVGVIAVKSNGMKKILLAAPEKPDYPGYMRAKTLNMLREADLRNDEIIAGRPNMAGEGPAQNCSRRVKEYLKMHPKATWKEIYANVDNHYSSVISMQNALRQLIKY